MRQLTILSAALVLAAPPAFAQTRANSSSTSPSGRYGAIGCLAKQGAGANTRFTIVDTRGESPTTYRVQGDADLLTKHVGHTVELSGSLTPPPAGSGQYTMKVSTLVWIASSCATGPRR